MIVLPPDPLSTSTSVCFPWIVTVLKAIVADLNSRSIDNQASIALVQIATDLRYQTNEIRKAKGEPAL